MKPQIVYIICLSRSGSTLLGNIIGSHHEAMHLGEMVAPLDKQFPVKCRVCLDDPCPVWGRVITERDLITTYREFRRCSTKIMGFFALRRKRQGGKPYHLVGRAFPDINVLVDSSKNLDWCKFHYSNKKFDFKYIFLVRDLRGVFASSKRSFGTSLNTFATSASAQIDKFRQFYDDIDSASKLSLSYEQLVGETELCIKQMVAFLSLSFDESMLDPNSSVHHLIGGNPSYIMQFTQSKVHVEMLEQLLKVQLDKSDENYYLKSSSVEMDRRWQTELNDEEKMALKALNPVLSKAVGLQ